jgi:transposase
MADVMIGIDPHKSSHTAVAIGLSEEPLGELQVRACPSQAEQLLAWAAAWPERAWAVEGAAGLGHLLAQQLVAAGEPVLDVPPKLAARVRLLQAGDTSKNDPNDALSVAVAALRSTAPRPVLAEDHAVLKVWAKRHRDLGRSRNQAACRLHAVLCDLVPGGVRKEISAGQAARILERVTPSGAVARARCELAAGFLTDIRRLDAQLRDTHKKLAAAVRDSRTSLTGIFGVGPVIAGTVIGDVRHVSRFGSRDHFAACNGTAPVEVSSGGRKICRLSLRGNRRLNHATHTAAITQIRHKHSQGRAYYEKKLAEGKTHKEALRCLKRRISDAIYAALVADAQRAATAHPQGPGGHPGNRSVSRAAGDPAPPQVAPPVSRTDPTSARPCIARPLQGNPSQPLDTGSKEDSLCAILDQGNGHTGDCASNGRAESATEPLVRQTPILRLRIIDASAGRRDGSARASWPGGWRPYSGREVTAALAAA